MTNSPPKLEIVGRDATFDILLLNRLKRFMEKHPHITPKVLARKENVNFSEAAIAAYLKETYFLSKELGGQGVQAGGGSRLETNIRAYLDRMEGTEREQGYRDEFVETATWKRFSAACNTAIERNVIVVLYGPPGLGKSRCLREYAKRNLTTSPVMVLCSANVTTRFFAQKIGDELRLNTRLSTAELEDKITERLKRSPRPIFVDQANYLNDKGLGLLCHIWEVSQVPIVMLGTQDLFSLFSASRLTEDVRMQLATRVEWPCPLAELSQKECTRLVEQTLGTVSEADAREIYRITRGNFRFLARTLRNLTELRQANGDAGELADLIEAARARLIAS